MKHHYMAKNPELTQKALLFIEKYGRNTFDEMINDLLTKKISPIKEGWLLKKIKLRRR